MDLPVLGRFFGTTVDDSRRQELVMMISPRVIRNRDESKGASEEFKSKLTILRNELEKLRVDREKDLEKLKRQTQEQPKPVEPLAPPTEPARPPVSAPAQQNLRPRNPSVAPTAPLVESSVDRDDSRPPTETQGDLDAVLAALESAVDTAGSEKPVGAAAAAGTSSERLDTATAAGARTKKACPTVKSRGVVVQVGAVAQAGNLTAKDEDKGTMCV
jgi:hypothetical protein